MVNRQEGVERRKLGKEAGNILYQRALTRTRSGVPKSQISEILTHCAERKFGMTKAISLRRDHHGSTLRRLARRAKDAAQVGRLLALASIYDGRSRQFASEIGGVTVRIIRDWVVRFNERGLDGLSNGKAPGARGYIFSVSEKTQGFLGLKGYADVSTEARLKGWSLWLTLNFSPAAPKAAN
jgi:hypothetical protein